MLLPFGAVLISLLLVGCGAGAPVPSGAAASSAPAASLTAGATGASIPRDLCANLVPDCALAPGSYLAQLFRPPLAFELGSGWTNVAYTPRALQILRDETSSISVVSGELLARSGELGTSPAELVAYLRRRPGLSAGVPKDVTVGGLKGVALEVRVGQASVALFDQPLAGGQKDPFLLRQTETARFIALEAGGQRVLIVVEAPSAEFATFLREAAQPVLDSLSFSGAGPSP